MRAIRMHEFGPAGVLQYEELDDPKPGPGQVRIAVAASGVHLVDTTIRSGAMADGPLANPRLPTIPGREVAGRVDAVGDDVDPDWLGARVVAHLGAESSGYAELAVVSEVSLHRLGRAVADDAAVAMIGTGRTAVGVLDVAAITPDDVVLVTAAAGGLGTLFVQASRAAGAVVIGVAGGGSKVRVARELGALAVDYSRSDWPAEVRAALDDRPITVALDGVGGDIGAQALDLVSPNGRLVLFGYSAGAPTEINFWRLYATGVRVAVALGPHTFAQGRMRGLEERALAAADSGMWRPLIQRFPLRDAAAAHTAIEARATTGKVVLIP
ncbi:MAG: zinc-binding dehydrogenase [Candidatus Nanopelagicales bacterium]